MQDVNLKSVFLCCKHGIPHLLETGGGSVINTASFVAVMGAATSQISYTASKGGVLALSRELGVEFARRGVRVNALCPGPVDTPLLRELYANDPEEAARRMVHVPMGRFAEAVELANAALFLASDEASYITASTFLVDGGLVRRLRHAAVAVAAPRGRAGAPLVAALRRARDFLHAVDRTQPRSRVFAAAMAVETAHLLDDGLLNPHDGVTDVPSALIAVAIAVAAVALYRPPRHLGAARVLAGPVRPRRPRRRASTCTCSRARARRAPAATTPASATRRPGAACWHSRRRCAHPRATPQPACAGVLTYSRWSRVTPAGRPPARR